MPAWRREVPLPRLWFLTVRMVEVATLALVLGAGLELWEAFRASGQFTPDGGDSGSATTPVPFMRRVVALAFYSGLFRAPLSLVLAAFLLAGAVAVLASGQPVRHARLLRWEVLGIWALAALGVVVLVLLNAVAVFGDNPYASNDPSVISGYAGPGLVEQAAMGLSWPVGAALVMAAVGLWWLRLPADPGADLPAATDLAAETGLQTGGPATAETPHDESSGDAASEDRIVLDDVEQIEPVEALWRNGSSGDGATDGGTPNGYEDFFRRF
jgi:hypothetical protein